MDLQGFSTSPGRNSVTHSTEHINRKIAVKLLNHPDVNQDQKDILKCIIRRIKSDKLNVNYYNSRDVEKVKKSIGAPNSWGRLYGYGVQRLSTAVRNTICNGIATDIDMVNAHPVIMSQFAQQNGVEVPYLADYAVNRDNWLHAIMTKGNIDKKTAKTAVLRAIYGSTHKAIYDTLNIGSPDEYPEELVNISNDVKALSAFCCTDYNDPQVPSYADMLRAGSDVSGIAGYLSHIVGNIENNILQTIRQVISSYGYNDVALMFDGIVVFSNIKPNLLNVIINEAEQAIKEQHNYDIKLVVKPIEAEYNLNEITEESEEVAETLNTQFDFFDDGSPNVLGWVSQDFSNYIAKNHFDKFRSCNGELYACVNNIWRQLPTYTPIVVPIINDLIINTHDQLKELLAEDKILNNVKGMRKIIDSPGFCKQIDKHLSYKVEDDCLKDKLYDHPGKLIFKNGILDMGSLTFNKEYKPEDYICKDNIINWDYDATPNLDDQDFIRSRLLQIQNNNMEQLEYVLRLYGYALSGMRTEAVFVNNKGVRTGNGKSTITDTLRNIMPNIVKVYPSIVLENGYSKRHKYMNNTNGVRIMAFEELPSDKSLDNDFIKTITGGSEYQNEVMFANTSSLKIQFTPFANSNHTPQFKTGVDMSRRYVEINNDCKFWDADSYNSLKNKTDKDFLADNTLKNKLIEKKNAWIHILCGAYQQYLQQGLNMPDFVKEWGCEGLDGSNDVKHFVDDNFITTQVNDDRIGRCEMELMCKGANIQLRNVKDYLKTRGVIYKRDHRINGKKGCFVGLKRLEFEE